MHLSLTPRFLQLCSFALSLVASASAADFDVRAFGATGNGETLDSPAVNKAIEAAAAAGGGTVRFPAGKYLSFSIRLKSNITLHLDPGATIVAATPKAGFGHYDEPEVNEWGSDGRQYQDYGHSHWRNSLIWGDGVENVAITGHGRIDGTNALTRGGGLGGGRGGAGGRGQGGGPNGTAPGATTSTAPAAGTPAAAVAATPPASAPVPPVLGAINPTTGLPARGGGAGNKAIALKNARNVTIRDISVLEGGHFAFLLTGVDNLTLDNIKVDTNRDGFDIDACRNVRMSNCSVNAPHDDAIVLKSSFGLGEARPCENITITNCQVTGYDIGSFLDGTYKRTMERAPDRDGPTGRIKFGTESNGGFKNITISNCVFDRSRGLALETVDGGFIEDITISNITMRDIVNAPIFIRLGNRARGPAGLQPGVVRRVQISNVTVKNADPRYPSIIAGLPGHPIEDVRLSNIQVEHRGGMTMDQVAQQPAEMVNTFFLRGQGLTGPRDPFLPPEQEKAYPEPSMFGLLPAHGFYVRHAKNLVVRDAEVRFLAEDKRPAVVLDDVDGATFDSVKLQRGAGAPLFVLRGVKNFSTRAVAGFADVQRAAVENESL